MEEHEGAILRRLIRQGKMQSVLFRCVPANTGESGAAYREKGFCTTLSVAVLWHRYRAARAAGVEVGACQRAASSVLYKLLYKLSIL